MAHPSITIVANPSVAEIGAVWPRIAAAWPQGRKAPEPTFLTLNELLEALAKAAEGQPPAAPALVVLGPDIPMVGVVQLVDALQGALVPAVLLFDTVDDARRRLQSDGVIIERLDAEPAYIAAILFALREREPAVRSLARDLQIAARYEGGARGEIDRIHEELNLAAAVQQELLPKRLPTVSGLECGVLFRPVGYVSGDIYDVVELDEHHLGIFIADAVGHGVPAALLTMVISRSLRSTQLLGTPGHPVRPGEALARLNEDLIRGQRGGPARFATAVYGIIDTRTLRVTIAGAGHPPPLRVRRGHTEPVTTDGPLLGVFPAERFEDIEFDLEPGETLLLHSDGFETAFPGRDANGRQRRATNRYLEQIAAVAWPDSLQGGTLAAAIEDLAERIDCQTGSLHQADDLTAVAIAPSLAAAAPRSARQAQAA